LALADCQKWSACAAGFSKQNWPLKAYLADFKSGEIWPSWLSKALGAALRIYDPIDLCLDIYTFIFFRTLSIEGTSKKGDTMDLNLLSFKSFVQIKKDFGTSMAKNLLHQ
jgi:hypothetical protein